MIYNSVSLDTGVAEVNQLVSSRGMIGMLNTVYLIICAMCFGACMRASGMIGDLTRVLLPLTRTRAGLVGSTVTSPLFPWSSCGMTQATILSVPTLAYAPFCFFNILSPLMSFLIGVIGWKIVRKAATEEYPEYKSANHF